MKNRNTFAYLLSILFLLFPSLLCLVFDYGIGRKNPFVIQDGVMDFQYQTITKETSGIPFNGTMEFYYNKWLMEDKEEDVTPDGYIEMPSFWTEMKIDGNPLPKSGYATYRFTIINMPIGISLTADSDYFYSSFRIYFDDVLIGQSGTPNKDASLDKKDIRFTRRGNYQTTSSTMTVTIEVGNSMQAGLVKAPSILSSNITQAERRGKELFLFLILGLLVGCFLILTAASLLSDGVKKALPRIVSSVSLLLYWLFSAEGLKILKLVNIPSISYPFYKLFSIIFLGVFLLSSSFWLTSSMKSKKKAVLMTSNTILTGTLLISIILLLQTPYFLIPYFVLLFFTIGELFYFVYKGRLKKINRIYFIFFFFLLGFMTLSMLNDANLFYQRLSYILSLSLLVGDLILYLGFFYSIVRMKKDEEKKNRLQQEQSSLKALALHEQINPNMIFNTLSVIEDFYHQETITGDKALNLYSDYLRYSINSMESVLVTFEEEVNNIMIYADFENMRQGVDLPVILNIQYSQFMVPPLLLKTLISYFFRHLSDATGEERNMVEIASEEGKKNIVIHLIDHREGYPIDNEEEEIRNLKERLELTLNARLIFRYDIRTTEFIVLIPKKKG